VTGTPVGEAAAGRAGFGPLGRRLLAAFLFVALSSVAVLATAGLIGTGLGLAAARQSDRQHAAAAVAALAARAYQAAGGWQYADLTGAADAASSAGARLAVRDAAGQLVVSPGGGHPLPGHGPATGGHIPGADGHGQLADSASAAGGVVSAPVVSGGRAVGSVQLMFGTPAAASARGVAWWWIGAAALAALAVALAVSWFVSRRLAIPLVYLSRAARSFAAGDRAARSGVTGPGELGDLGRAFDAMADEVARSESARRLLAADIAHELRTPLAALQAGLEELRDGLEPASPPRLASLHDQALRLGRVVDDLGELSAAESSALSLRKKEVDLTDLARSVLAAREPELRAAGIGVRADLAGPVTVCADPDRIHQVIGNLLANAARYCRPGDVVTVRAATAGPDAVIAVADTGPGIDDADLAHVFDRLWRGRTATGIAGHGIGLAVVREIVTAHGGTATAASGPGGGAVFTIRLPQQDRPRAASPWPGTQRTAKGGAGPGGGGGV
jgi:two-component system sensor histidine kinase BaeS